MISFLIVGASQSVNYILHMFRSRTAKSVRSNRGGGGCEEANIGISIRALWEQMEELIDLLDQVSAVQQGEGRLWRSQHRDQYPRTLGTDGRTY
jgi:hypothetical protein